ncbi:ribosome hibernation-promoting factor, HPF/YfiA family [Microcella sp.]|uniref:ribosome hibernation-promoting factor, HPF/YfiA family n=1 Tax=Microcella sp. TaxID=1913979 RepID=UPI00299F5BA4|nr:ribosome-associated translation inhibitor RaiA [Microcella sp.]MDX2026805.1 ribosome-associated translation inhibitor RaiA [Microcella sp.]
MDITITGRNIGITDRFRDYATEKAEKIEHLADRAQVLEIKVSRHHEKSAGKAADDRVEMTLIGAGPVVRAESAGSDKYVAFDLAIDKLLERLRRAKDKRKVHRGNHRPVSLHEASADGFRVIDITPADPDIIKKVATGSIPVQQPAAEDADEVYSPIVVRQKVFPAVAMTVDDAVDQLELVGHDFFLFIDSATDRPSVVYRRQGWNYGVIGLEAEQSAAVVNGRRGR